MSMTNDDLNEFTPHPNLPYWKLFTSKIGYVYKDLYAVFICPEFTSFKIMGQ